MADGASDKPSLIELSASVSVPQAGHARGTDQLFTSLYEQLRRMARREAARLGPDAPLGATTLLHEAWLDMSKRNALNFPSEGQFMAYAARAMRGLVVDRVRERQAHKRGGGLDITSLDTDLAEHCAQPELLIDIDAALQALAELDLALAQVVDLKFFCGFSMVEIGSIMGTSERTAQRQWEKARTLLYMLLRSG